ncbi:MAG TPA: site-2 protease family protein [Lacunisphaera sp.]
MLGWSINLFRLFGIQLSVHATFFLLLAYAGYEGWATDGLIGLAWHVMLTVCFFCCVILHELGHCLTAQRYGVRVPRILLLPIGGMAEMEQIPRRPSAEFLITVAGPAVNFAIVAILLPFGWRYLLGLAPIPDFSVAEAVTQMILANLVMGTFNLLPVYPMDGGRILRSILALWLPYLRATWWSVTITRVLAPIFAAIAIFYLHWWMLGLLFIFILMAAGTEYRILVRREQEAAYWAEMARRVSQASASSDEPPLIAHGPN